MWVGSGETRHIATRVTFRVDETYKGEAAAQQTLEFFGGTVGDTTQSIPGVPQFEVGQSTVLFVVGNGLQFCPPGRRLPGTFSPRQGPGNGAGARFHRRGRSGRRSRRTRAVRRDGYPAAAASCRDRRAGDHGGDVQGGHPHQGRRAPSLTSPLPSLTYESRQSLCSFVAGSLPPDALRPWVTDAVWRRCTPARPTRTRSKDPAGRATNRS